MKITKALGRIGIKKLWHLFVLGLRNPLFVVPTFLATKNCIRLSTKYFGRLHYQNGPANAFRHALWNYLIAKRCFKVWRNEEKVISWTKKITDWHEEAFQNNPLARIMDYHNNEVGRALYLLHKKDEKDKVVEQFLAMTDHSKIINAKTDLSELSRQLVHIMETE